MSLLVLGYSLGERLFKNEKAEIYQARRLQDGRPLVLKICRKRHPEANLVRQYHREYTLLRYLYPLAPQVVEALDMKFDGELVYLAMELCPGQSLSRLLPQVHLEQAQFLELAKKLALVLEAIHQAGVVHLDINPSNLIWDQSTGGIKLIDFGIAQWEGEASQNKPKAQVQGTLEYMSPEQTGKEAQSLDHRSDLYSLGVVFYRMLAGEPPFHDLDPASLMHHHLHIAPRKLDFFAPNLNPDLVSLVHCLLEKDPGQRFQTAWDLHQALLSLG